MEHKEIITKWYSDIGSKGSKNRWSKATPEQRKEIGRKLAEARKNKRERELSPEDVAT